MLRKIAAHAVLFGRPLSYSAANGMGAPSHDSPAGPAGGQLGADLSAHVESIVRAAEREARNAEEAIAAQRRSAEEEARRYLAAARLRVDAEAAARAARVETLSAAARRLADELSDAVTALRRELARDAEDALPHTPWPAQAEPARAPASEPRREAQPAAEPTPEPTWSRAEQPAPEQPTAASASAAPAGGDTPVPSAARLVAIEMAVGGSSRAEVEEHLRERLGVGDPQPLLDDVFGAASHAHSKLAWGEA